MTVLDKLRLLYYRILSVFIPSSKPTKNEVKIIESRRGEPVISLDSLKNRLRV